MTFSSDDRIYLASKGLCTSCGKRPAMRGVAECVECRERRIIRAALKKNPDCDPTLCHACHERKRVRGTNRCKQCTETKTATRKREDR